MSNPDLVASAAPLRLPIMPPARPSSRTLPPAPTAIPSLPMLPPLPVLPSTLPTSSSMTPPKAAGAPGERRCVHCNASSTPLWRRSPVGPKTLCNACGVRMKKGRLAYIDGRFVAVESAAAIAKRRKAEAAARTARENAGSPSGGPRGISKAKTRPRARGRSGGPGSGSARKSRSFPAAASGLYYLLAAIDFVEAS